MFVIDVTVKTEKATEEQLKAHLAYCKSEFDKGNFVMCGPSITYENRGIIIAKAESPEALDIIIKNDPLFDAAVYDIHEFKASLQ